jgi:hypothetical protein
MRLIAAVRERALLRCARFPPMAACPNTEAGPRAGGEDGDEADARDRDAGGPLAGAGERCRAGGGARGGGDRDQRVDGVCAADAGEAGGDLRAQRARRDDQEDPAEGPAPRDRLGRHRVRGHDRRDLDRLERQRRADPADLPARQVLRCGRHGRPQRDRLDRGAQGQDRGGLGARNRTLHSRLPGSSPRTASR